MRRPSALLLVLCSLGLAAGCAGEPAPDPAPPVSDASKVRGQERSFRGGDVESWARLLSDGTVNEVGVSVPFSLLGSAPSAEEVVRLSFPAQVPASTVVHHVDFAYSPGHAPEAYGVAHVDLRFHAFPEDARPADDCLDVTPAPAAGLPEGYVAAPPGPAPQGGCVPGVGVRAVDAAREGPLTAAIALGYYAGEFAVLEPSVARSMLLEKQGVLVPVPRPPSLDKAVRYPAIFRAHYDAEDDAYDFVLSDFRAG